MNNATLDTGNLASEMQVYWLILFFVTWVSLHYYIYENGV